MEEKIKTLFYLLSLQAAKHHAIIGHSDASHRNAHKACGFGSKKLSIMRNLTDLTPTERSNQSRNISELTPFELAEIDRFQVSNRGFDDDDSGIPYENDLEDYYND